MLLETDIKRKSRFDNRHGGNRRPQTFRLFNYFRFISRLWLQTFRLCFYCGIRFGPINRLKRKCTTKARSAQSLVAYHVNAGNIVKPSICEDCGATDKKIEAAHYNYYEPLKVKWLCRSCHAKWDFKEPKGGTC